MARRQMNKDQRCLLVAMVFVGGAVVCLTSNWPNGLMLCSFVVGICCGVSFRNIL